MSDHASLQKAHEVITAYEAGAYDEQTGVTPEERALLTKAAGDGPLTPADVSALWRINRPDLIDAAHRANRINLNPDTQEN
jgi:hypothetical protein